MSKHTPGPWDSPWRIHRIRRPNEEVFEIFWKDDGDGVTSYTYVATARQYDNAQLIAAAPELDAYRQYIEDNLERIERGGWTPICFDEFRESEECANYMKEEA
jgi:hypothetical protein